MEKYDIDNDKHIIAIGQVVEECAEITCKAYLAWRRSRSEKRIDSYRETIQHTLAQIPNVEFRYIVKQPFGFVFTIYGVDYKFFVFKIGPRLLRGSCIQID